MSPTKRSSKDAVTVQMRCEDALGGLGWSNEKRSAKAERAGGGSDRLSNSSDANSATAPVGRLAGWIEAKTNVLPASARDPAFAVSVSSVNHR